MAGQNNCCRSHCESVWSFLVLLEELARRHHGLDLGFLLDATAQCQCQCVIIAPYSFFKNNPSKWHQLEFLSESENSIKNTWKMCLILKKSFEFFWFDLLLSDDNGAVGVPRIPFFRDRFSEFHRNCIWNWLAGMLFFLFYLLHLTAVIIGVWVFVRFNFRKLF